jgi:CMP-N-acetylneuraminic acid synthetase
VPRKNLQTVGGISLLERAITCGMACPSLNSVYVSTDDSEIATRAIELGASVPELRPQFLSGDDSPEIEAWKHAIGWICDETGRPNFDVFVSLPPTAPFRTPELVETCISQLSSEVDMVVTGYRSIRHPSFNMVERNDAGLVQLLHKPEFALSGRQQASPSFDLTTVAYVSRPSHLLQVPNLLSGRVRLVEVDRFRGLDIDDQLDLVIANSLAQGDFWP